MNKYIKLYENFKESELDINIDILDSAWIYFHHIVKRSIENVYKNWKNNTKMNGRKFSDTISKLNISYQDDDIIDLQPFKSYVDKYFSTKNFEGIFKKEMGLKKLDPQKNDLYNYPISRIPFEYFMHNNPKIEEQFYKIYDMIVDHHNSGQCDTRFSRKLIKMRGIKLFNIMNFNRTYPEKNEYITIYRGVNDYRPNPTNGDKTSLECWTTDIEQGKRFAKFIFTGDKQFRPTYSSRPTLLQAEIKSEDIKAFIGGEESEVLLFEPKNITTTDLWKIKCDNAKCDHSWEITKGDPDPYLCHKCGYDNHNNKFNLPKLKKWQENNKDIKL